uniref:EOG090X0BNZ n=1 Tax=Daphnia similis TaxID=35528 RepID=A0A4Y7N222_9CRUS|nr:EOG090X0BNZ [Daphnia similis]SVE87585.1 EOG090X0BNZ [Daphnia similis]SVE88215.1 EOG090X0BNZ [Daphnia similis]
MSRFILCFCVALLQLVSGEVVETGFKYGQSELILNCSLPDDKVSWYYNGTLLVEADNLKMMHENSVHMLKIIKPKVAHIGSYTCEGSGKAVTDFRVAKGEEGQWESLIADGHFMFEPNNEGIANGTLLIEEVKLDDRDNYMCFASNDLGNHNGTTLIRVIVSVRQGPSQRSFYLLENIAPDSSVSDLKKNILLKAGLDSQCQIELIYSCKPLRDEATLNTLEHVESGAKMIYATVVKPAEREHPKKLNAVEQHQLFLAFRAAVTNPNFRHTLQNLSKPENIRSLTETVPGLADDEIALSMLQDWELLLHLADPKIVQVLVEKHPALVDAASRMMNSVSESLVPGANQRQRSNSAGWLARSLGADLEDMDEDVPQDQPNSNQQASRSQAAFGSGITPAQLAAALNFAQNSIRRIFKLNFTLITFYPILTSLKFILDYIEPLPSTPTTQQQQQQPRVSPGISLQQPEQSTPRPRNDGLTPEMFTQALLQAMNQMGGGSISNNTSGNVAMASSIGTTSSVGAETRRDTGDEAPLREIFGRFLPQMREYGITDDNLSLRALQATNGDVEAALNLIYAGLVDD